VSATELPIAITLSDSPVNGENMTITNLALSEIKPADVVDDFFRAGSLILDRSVHQSSHDSDRVRTVSHTEVSRPQWAASLGQTFRAMRLRSEATSKSLSVQQQVIGTMFVFLSNDSCSYSGVGLVAAVWFNSR
jgi:hypothetical protein